MKMILALALAASLSACATTSVPSPASPAVLPLATTAVDRAEAAYARARPYALMLLPYLSPARQVQVRLAMTTIERALAAARLATTAVEQLRELRRAEGAMTIVTAGME